MTVEELIKENKKLMVKLEGCHEQIDFLSQEVSHLKNSKAWKATAPYRVLGDKIKELSALIAKGYFKLIKFFNQNVFAEIVWKNRRGFNISPFAFGLRRKVFDMQRKTFFQRPLKFSVIVTLCKISKKDFQEMIGSLLFQSYENWELCLVDFCSDGGESVSALCDEIALKDKRIKYKRMEGSVDCDSGLSEAAEMATGDFLCLLDCGDLLHPAALYQVMQAICQKDADFVYTDEVSFEGSKLHKIISTNFKPDYAPDYFNSMNYIQRFAVFNKKLFEAAGGFHKEFGEAQDYDLFLRLFERTDKIVHVPEPLYYCRLNTADDMAYSMAKNGRALKEKKLLQDHFDRMKIDATVVNGRIPNTYKIDYKIKGSPLVSILIPSYEHWQTLKKCVESIKKKSTYQNYEIIVIENNSKDSATFEYYDSLKNDKKIKILTWQGKFNYSAINNFGAKYAKGDYFLLLNNDVEVISPSWIEEMLMFAQRKNVGAVGAMLYYPSDKIQHSGVVIGIYGAADHVHKFFPRNSAGYSNRLSVAQNLSCVTAACCMIPRKVYQEMDGLDEIFEVAFNDVDLCARIRKAGYLVVWTPFAELYHYESESRGIDDTPEKVTRAAYEIRCFQRRWKKELLEGDPYYNKNLTLLKKDFSVDGDFFPAFKNK
ncbi:MAG: glycosyltransferase family 2 protein [Clostridiales bacterium]|nr:glycosyltransferase family 2 protein [Clostridiales bacterium]